MKKYIHAAGFFIVLTVFSCTYLQERLAVKKCKFNLTQVEVQKFTFSDITLALHIAIANPNKIDVKIDKMDYVLYIENKKTVNGKLDPVAIPSKKTKTVVATLVIPFNIIGMAIVDDMSNKGEISYQLVGTVYLETKAGIITFPVTISTN